MKAAIYVRISQDSTGERAGVTRQREDCEKLCADRGYEVAQVYEDNSVSAFSGRERPAWRRLWDTVALGGVDVIVSWHPDRMYRRMRDLVEVTELVQRHGVRVETVTAGDVDLSTPEGVMQAQIIGAVAEKESADKRRRITRWHESRAASGAPPGGGTRAFGYDREKVTEGSRLRTVWTIRSDEAETFREIVTRILAGESLTAVRNRLNNEGRLTSTGNAWSVRTLKRMLMSPTPAAMRRTKDGELVEGTWPALIERSQWEALQVALERRSMTAQRDSVDYCLSGVLRCECGHLMWGHRRQSRRRYECRSSADGARFVGCGSISSSAVPLEDFVRALIVEALDADALARLRSEEAGDDERQGGRLAEVERLERAYDALADDYADGAIPRDAFARASRKLEARLDRAKAEYRTGQRNGVLAMVGEDDVATAWDQGSASWRRALVEQVFDHLELGPARCRGGQFDRSRVAVTWRI